MKRAGMLIALVALTTLVAGTAYPATVRRVRSPRRADNPEEEEEEHQVVRRGNVVRTSTTGNVRRSESPRSHVTTSPPVTKTPCSETRRVAGSSSTPVAGSSSAPVAGSTRHPVSGSTRRPVAGSTRHPVAGSSRREAGNVRRVANTTGSSRKRSPTKRHSVRNVPYATRKTAPSRTLRTHPSYAERPDRVRHRETGCWASSHSFTYRHADTSIRVHSGPRGPYWHKGRWHPYRQGRRRVLYYGYWIDTSDYYYVNRIEPPWARSDYWDDDDVVVSIEYDEPSTRVVEADYDYVDEAADGSPVAGDFILKRGIVDAVIVKELQLSTTECRRVDKLIAHGILRQVLEEGGRRSDADYDFDERRRRLTLTAPSERIAMIETMVRDERTFEAVIGPNRYGHMAAVVVLVSPLYLESDFRGAVQLATDNFDALRRLLEERDWRDARDGTACWLNAEYGTATVIDEEGNIERAFELMENQPFVPKDFVREP